ncbi:acetyltransferase [Aureococcus anophagefferens]|nr:acetyltransferase [Aureococcus anophagefferens]
MDRRPSGKAAVLSFPETERLSSANLMAVPMYLQHGFTSICTASALAETGALRYMMEHERWSLRSLCEASSSSRATKSCVHLLVSLDLLVDEGGGGYRRAATRRPCGCPSSPSKYLSYDFAKVFDQNVNTFFAQIDLTGPKLPRGTSEAFKTTHLRLDESSLGPSVLAIFQGLGWCADNAEAHVHGHELPKILMGDGSIFAAQEADGHEVHVDRVLNVIASGAQHKRFFEHMCNGVFNRVFDDQPLEDQPAAVADMGCGDGRLLLTLYEYVRDHTKRGKHLDKFPFTVIGIDFNYESLDVTKETLGSRNIPFEVQWGDIGDPDAAMDELEKRGFPSDSVLHWLLCAAGAGLFPAWRRCAFPDNVSRIMLSHFKPRGYKVRHARPSDLTRCLELEAKSWDPDMRTAASTVERRFEALPTCNFVMTRDDVVVGVVFFQFLDDVSSTMGGSIGQELRDFVMCYACVLRNVTEICGVTRARNFRAFADKGETYETYCLRNNGVHDSGLALHSRAGATLHKVVHNWRPGTATTTATASTSYAVGPPAPRQAKPPAPPAKATGVTPPVAPSPPASPSKKKKKEKVAKQSKWPAYVPPPCVRPEPKPLRTTRCASGRRRWTRASSRRRRSAWAAAEGPQRVVHPEPYMFDEMAKCDLLAIPMYLQHGFCLLSICSAMADLDVNITLGCTSSRPSTCASSPKLELRPGYCTSLINSLVTLGFIRERSMWGDEVQYEVDMEVFNDLIRLPYEPIADYLKFDFASIFRDDVDVFPTMDLQGPKIPKMQLLLEGFYLAPIVIYLRMHLHPSSAIFRRLDWLDKGTMKLTYKGTYVLAAALNAGVPISYYPMFQELPKILKGDGSIFAAQEADGHEVHVDRVLNVVASGAQHRRFFEHMCNGLLSRVFNDEPLEQQPRAVADMGCGDGRLLLTLYEYVRDQTKRGKHLDKHPLTLIGVDFNDESLEVTKATLSRAGVPFEVQWGDIGDPAFVVEALEKKGYARDSVLHVRSFLDHDRPYVAPKRDADAFRMQLPPLVAGYEMERCVSLAFDCCQTLSHQYLVPLPQWLVCAAARACSRAPRLGPESVSRIMLSHFKPRGYKIRHATLDDLDAVVALEAGCRGLELRTPRSVLGD